jgi:hypothetical protein
MAYCYGLTTLTTVSMGDICPTDLARSVVVLEAVIGRFIVS